MPNATLTKAEFAALLGRLIGAEENEENWYSGYVDALNEKGILPEKIVFDPESPITREEMAYMIAKTYAYMNEVTLEEVINQEHIKFLDEEDISDWAKKAVLFNKQLGIIEGNPDGTFEPQSYATRAQMAQMMLRLLNLVHTNN